MKIKPGYLVFNIAFIVLLYRGFGEDVEIAKTLSAGVAWSVFFLSLFTLDPLVQKSLAQQGKSAPRWIDTVMDVAVTGVFLSAGWNSTAAVYLVHSIIITGVWHDIDNRR